MREAAGGGLGAVPEGCSRCRGGRSPPGGSYRGVGGGHAWDPRLGSPPGRTCGFSCCPSSSCEAPPMVFQRSFPIAPPSSARSPRAPAPALPAPRAPHSAPGGRNGRRRRRRERRERRRRTRARTRGWALPSRQPRPPRSPPSGRGQGAEGERSVAPKLPPKPSSAPPVGITHPSPPHPRQLHPLQIHSGFTPISLQIHSRSRRAGTAGGAAAGKAVWSV